MHRKIYFNDSIRYLEKYVSYVKIHIQNLAVRKTLIDRENFRVLIVYEVSEKLTGEGWNGCFYL